MLKTVVHVNFSDPERQESCLGNVANILDEVKDEADIVVVCHGAGISLVVRDESQHADEVAGLIERGTKFVACENTLQSRSLSQENLLPGVAIVSSGAVEVILRQQSGYGYFRA